MRGQPTQGGYTAVEYAVLISATAVALVASQTLVKRAIQARLKVATDQIFAFSDDRAGSATKIGEKTQAAGVETHDAGSGILGSELLLTAKTERTADYTESKVAGVAGGITRDGTLERTNRTGVSFINDEQYVPPDFLRRPGGLEAVRDMPKGFNLPKPPDDVDRPITPADPDPEPTRPSPGGGGDGDA